MLSQEERNAIDAFLSHRGINFAALLRAEKLGYNLDILRLEIISKLRGHPQKQWIELPINFKWKERDCGLRQR